MIIRKKNIFNRLITLPLFYILTLSVVTQVNASSHQAPATEAEIAAEIKQWDMSLSGESSVLMLESGGVTVPIEVASPDIVLSHKTRGRFMISDGALSSLTRTPVLGAIPVTAPYVFRPTLFITLQGLRTNGSSDPWQRNLQEILHEQISRVGTDRYSQIVHLLINWESDHSNFTQTKNLVGEVKNFLDQRGYPWDVVILGYSRGAIIAHDMARAIKGHRNINNLHTFLIDPTAATYFGDIYPLQPSDRLINPGDTTTFGSLFFDNRTFKDQPLSNSVGSFGRASIGSVSDFPIPGYTNYGRKNFEFGGVEHAGLAKKWTGTNADFNPATLVDSKFKQALNDVWANKTEGSFVQDGLTNSFEIIIIEEDQDFIVGLDVGIEGGNLKIAASLSFNKLLPAAQLRAQLGLDNAELAVATFLGSAMAKINKDGAAVAVNTDFGIDVGAGFDKHGVYAEIGLLDAVSASASIGKGDIVVSARLFGTKVELKLSSAVKNFKKAEDQAKKLGTKLSDELKNVAKGTTNVLEDVVNAVGNVVGEVGDAIGNAAGKVGDAVGNAVGKIGGMLGF